MTDMQWWWDASWEEIERRNHNLVIAPRIIIPREVPDPDEYDGRPGPKFRACARCNRRMDRDEPLYAQACSVVCAFDVINRTRALTGQPLLSHAEVAARFDLPWTADAQGVPA